MLPCKVNHVGQEEARDSRDVDVPPVDRAFADIRVDAAQMLKSVSPKDSSAS